MKPIPKSQLKHQRHHLAHDKGGIHQSKHGFEGTNEAMGDVVRLLSTQLLKGKFVNLLTFKKPVKLCKAVSFLETIAIENSYTDYLSKASHQGPFEQIKLITSFFVTDFILTQKKNQVAGFHAAPEFMGVKAPLEPRLGETYQAYKEDGTQFYSEVIKTNPQVILSIIDGDGYRMTMNNQTVMVTKNQMNTLVADQSGIITITMGNNVYKVQYPQMLVWGLIMGERILHYQGQLIITCEQTQMKSILQFDQIQDGIGSLVKGFFKKQEEVISDRFNLKIYMDDTIVGQGRGSWLDHIEIDGLVYWNIQHKPSKWQQQENVIPSDSRLRQDRKLMLEGLLHEAWQIKQTEDQQDDLDLGLRRR